MKLPQLAVPHSKLLFGTKFFTPSVEICGNHCSPLADSASATSSSHNVPVPLNQNCNRLAAAARSSRARNRKSNCCHCAPGVNASSRPAFAQRRVSLRATSTAAPRMLSPLAQNVSRYHWPSLTLTLPIWQIIAWKSGPSPVNSVQDNFAHRLPSRPVSKASCCRTASLPVDDQSSGTPGLSWLCSNEPLATRLVPSAWQGAAAISARMAKKKAGFIMFTQYNTGCAPITINVVCRK